MFYLTLPSNSSHLFYPNNHAGHVFTKLPQSFDLDSDYEVGLTEIVFSNTYFNVEENECWFKFRLDTESDELIKQIPAGLYRTIDHLIDTIYDLIKSSIRKKRYGDIKILYNNATKKVYIRLYKKGGSIELSPSLTNLFKFEENVGMWGPAAFESSGIVQMHENFEGVYVYCDLIESRVVGDVMSPLLRIVPVDNRSSDVVHHIFEKPNYVPLRQFQFNAVEILLTTDTGKTLSFEGGKSVVTLHFRRKRPEYF